MHQFELPRVFWKHELLRVFTRILSLRWVLHPMHRRELRSLLHDVIELLEVLCGLLLLFPKQHLHRLFGAAREVAVIWGRHLHFSRGRIELRNN